MEIMPQLSPEGSIGSSVKGQKDLWRLRGEHLKTGSSPLIVCREAKEASCDLNTGA